MASYVAWIAAAASGLALAALAWDAARPPTPRPSVAVVQDPTRWPGDRATLTLVDAAAPEGFVARVALDPGHGASQNRGNLSCFCVDEQDAMMDLADEIAARLEATGRFEVRLTRDRGALVEYGDRLADAEAWGADAFVSLHSDVRGHASQWAPEAGRSCPISLEAPGFSVLYSDEGDAGLTGRRLALGRAVARRMEQAGFLAYGGAAYAGLYGADGEARGVFVDRHAPEQRIFVLRRTGMPAVLVETHNALDPREATRWRAKETLDVFAASLGAALVDAIGNGHDG